MKYWKKHHEKQKAKENYTQGGRKISAANERQYLFELLFAVM